MNEPITTAKALRNQCKKPKEKQPCYICGKHKLITELHHVIPLSECSRILNEWGIGKLSVPVVWLCPNCHAYAHVIRKGHFYKIADSVVEGSLSRNDFDAFKSIQDMENEAFSDILKKDGGE